MTSCPLCKAGHSEVKEPAKVEVKKDVVTATMQDGINAAVKARRRS